MSDKLDTIERPSTAEAVEPPQQPDRVADYANTPRADPAPISPGAENAWQNRWWWWLKNDDNDDEEEEEETFFEQYGTALVVGTLVMLGIGAAVFWVMSGESAPVRKTTNTIVSVQLPPPPPPPPKIQPPPPPPEQKMIEQPPLDKPEDQADKPVDEPPALGTNIKGNGPSVGGLGTAGNGRGLGSAAGNRRGGPFDRYARQVQDRIQEAVRTNRRTRNANLRVEVRVWPDQAGRITRAQLVSSTGDAAVDNALKSEVLIGLQLQEPPPPGMPSPIVLRVTARRPS